MRNTIFYLIEDLAFLPVQILIVTFIIQKFLDVRNKRERMRKIHVVINVFFSEAGTDCMLAMSEFVDNFKDIKQSVLIKQEWNTIDFENSIREVKYFNYSFKSIPEKLHDLNQLLISKRQFMLSLFSNQNLLEHDEFTDMLWAVFHIADELHHRDKYNDTTDENFEHILLDVKRAYPLILVEWLHYMQNIKTNYPYLYGFSIKNNPFEQTIILL